MEKLLLKFQRFVVYLEMESHYEIRAGLEPLILLPLPP